MNSLTCLHLRWVIFSSISVLTGTIVNVILVSGPELWNASGRQHGGLGYLQGLWMWKFQVILTCHVSWTEDCFSLQAEMVHTGLKLERALLVTASQCQQPAGVSLLDSLVCSDAQGKQKLPRGCHNMLQ